MGWGRSNINKKRALWTLSMSVAQHRVDFLRLSLYNLKEKTKCYKNLMNIYTQSLSTAKASACLPNGLVRRHKRKEPFYSSYFLVFPPVFFFFFNVTLSVCFYPFPSFSCSLMLSSTSSFLPFFFFVSRLATLRHSSLFLSFLWRQLQQVALTLNVI